MNPQIQGLHLACGRPDFFCFWTRIRPSSTLPRLTGEPSVPCPGQAPATTAEVAGTTASAGQVTAFLSSHASTLTAGDVKVIAEVFAGNAVSTAADVQRLTKDDLSEMKLTGEQRSAVLQAIASATAKERAISRSATASAAAAGASSSVAGGKKKRCARKPKSAAGAPAPTTASAKVTPNNNHHNNNNAPTDEEDEVIEFGCGFL
jgi:hypothetical protein